MTESSPFANWRHPWQRLDDTIFSGMSDRTDSVTKIVGTPGADRFTLNPNDPFTVISGNGNVEYGEGQYDLLDLSERSISDVAQWSNAAVEGVLFNAGSGARMYDGIRFSNNQEVLFEGLDVVQFSDKTIYLSICPNDPKFDRQWNLHLMDVHNAWRFTQGSPKILIGIQDSGLGYEADQIHPDLSEPIVFSPNIADDFSGNRQQPFLDLNCLTSHGTKVQSIISASSNNGEGISGINWHSKVAHVDVMGQDADDMTLDEATRFMLEVSRQKEQRLVVNMSLRNRQSNPAFNQLVEANHDNALFVVSVGNDSCEDITYPASLGKRYKNVIAVGAVWGKEKKGKFSQPYQRIDYAKGNGSNYGSGLSLMAPSEFIAASATPAQGVMQFDFAAFNQTSAAAPNVAGVASLVWSLCPELSAAQVHYILTETAYRPKDETDYSLETGYGLICADTAVRRAIAIKKYLEQPDELSTKSLPFDLHKLTSVAPSCSLAH